MQDVAGNLVWNFDTFNPVGLGVGGTPWAVNFGDQKKAFAFDNSLFDAGLCGGSTTPSTCNPSHVNFGLTQEKVPNWSLRNDGIGMKWDFQLPHPSIRFALTDWWGVGQTPVFTNSTIQVLADPAHPGKIFPGSNFSEVGRKLRQAREHQCWLSWRLWTGWWQYADYRNHAEQHPPGQRRESAQTFLNDCAFGGGAQIRYHKDNTLGLSADYFEPWSGVVIRVESSWTHNALLNDTDSIDWTTNNDIMQYVIGFDRPHFIKFLNPDRTFFSSFQVFETYYPGAHSTNGGKDGLVTGTNDFTFTAFTQTHYYRDQIIPLVFAAFGTEGTDATIGGNNEWLINDHWSAVIGFDAFLGKSHQHNIGPNAVFQAATQPQREAPYSESIFGPAHMGAGGAQRNKDDEFWTRLRYRF